MDDKFIEIKDLSYRFGDYLALDRVSFAIGQGQIAAMIGPNGSGKTTLLKNLIGLYEPGSGQILIGGQNPHQARQRIAYVPQRFEFDRGLPLTVAEFLGFYKCGNRRHQRTSIAGSLASVGLAGWEKRLLGELSGGQFQRMMVARAFLHEKDILILDEASAGIDVAGEATVYDLVAAASRERGLTCILVSHELSIVTRYAQQVICLNKKLCCFGPPEQVITPETLKSLFGAEVGVYHGH